MGNDPADCDLLVARAALGDAVAIEELVRLFRPRARAVARRIVGDPDEAEDVAQEAMGAALSGLARLRGEASLSTWIHRVAVNHALNHLRARRRRSRHEARAAEAADLLAPTPSVTERLEEEERRARVRAEIARIEPLFRQCLALRDVDGLTYGEIAAHTGLPVGTVKSRIHRARQRLLKAAGPVRKAG